MRLSALIDGASLGSSDTECSFSTCSSGGTPILTMTVIANHAKMMGTENRWIVRAMNGGVGFPLSAWWSEDLGRQVLGVEGFGVVDSGVGIRGAFLRAEDAVQPRHSQSPSTDHH